MDHQTKNKQFRKVKTKDILVSIIVMTYNSAKYVLETLESAKAQTYQNVELIISDDCSTDNTVEICLNWIGENGKKFLRAELITAEKNTGIPANCNRGVKAANGVWLKMIAGDDILDNHCIKNFIDYISLNRNASVISSSIQLFDYTFRKENFGKVTKLEEDMFFRPDTSAGIQYKMLLRKNYVYGASIMIKKATILDVGGFEEKYRLFEDHPMFLKLTKAGYKIYPLNIITVYYRQHDSSVLSMSKNRIFSDFYLIRRAFDLDYIYPNITTAERIADNIEFIRYCLFARLGLNRDTFFCKILFLVTSLSKTVRAIRNRALKKSIIQ